MSIEVIGNPKNPKCNKTHLDIEKANERGLAHRDYLAHSLRWTHVLKHVKKDDMNILDVGCGNAMLAQVLYVNKRGNCNYTGVEIRKTMLDIADKRKLKKEPRLIQMDITKDKMPVDDGWADIVTCFEVAEHIPPEDLDFMLKDINRCVKSNGVVLLSTPNYDGKHQAANHLKEYTEDELSNHLRQYFSITKKYGTFASQKDIEVILSQSERELWEKLKEYYDSNMFSVLFAPLYPSQSRNILWVLKKKVNRGSIGDTTSIKDDVWEIDV